MDFVTGLPVSTNWKDETYDSILIIIDRLTKMVHYDPVKVRINAPGLVEVIIDMVVRHHGLPNLIINDRGSVFTFKFWSLLCYFLGIRRNCLLLFTPRRMVRQNGKTALWKPTFGPLSTTSRMTRQVSCQ